MSINIIICVCILPPAGRENGNEYLPRSRGLALRPGR